MPNSRRRRHRSRQKQQQQEEEEGSSAASSPATKHQKTVSTSKTHDTESSSSVFGEVAVETADVHVPSCVSAQEENWQQMQSWIQYRLSNDVLWTYPRQEEGEGMTSVPGLDSQYKEVRHILLQTLDYADNQSTLLVGPRGCGKTWLLRRVLHDLYTERTSIHPTSVCSHNFLTLESMLGRHKLLAMTSQRPTPSSSSAATTRGARESTHDDDTSPPFVAVYVNGLLIDDDTSATKEISRQLASDLDIDLLEDYFKANPHSTDVGDVAASNGFEYGQDGRKKEELAVTRTSEGRNAATSLATNKSYDHYLSYVIDALREGRASKVPVFLIIDEFDLFAKKTRQTLLYSLLDLTQSSSVQIAVVGLSSRVDCVDMLEKRLKSRFSHSQVVFTLPTWSSYETVAKSHMMLPVTLWPNKEYARHFNSKVEEFVGSDAFDKLLKRFWALGRSVRWIKKWLYRASLYFYLSKNEELWTKSILEKAVKEMDGSFRLIQLEDLSETEMILLGTFARLEIDGILHYTFDDAYNEYLKFCCSEVSQTKPIPQRVMLKSLENLLLADMIKYEALGSSQGCINTPGLPPRLFFGSPQPAGSGINKQTMSNNAPSTEQDVHLLRQFHALRVLLDPEDVISAITEEIVWLPTDVRQWLTANAAE